MSLGGRENPGAYVLIVDLPGLLFSAVAGLVRL